MWFTGKLPVTLSALQKAILVGVGLQHKTVEEVAASLGGSVSTSHILGLFSQMMRKLSKVAVHPIALIRIALVVACHSSPESVLSSNHFPRMSAVFQASARGRRISVSASTGSAAL